MVHGIRSVSFLPIDVIKCVANCSIKQYETNGPHIQLLHQGKPWPCLAWKRYISSPRSASRKDDDDDDDDPPFFNFLFYLFLTVRLDTVSPCPFRSTILSSPGVLRQFKIWIRSMLEGHKRVRDTAIAVQVERVNLRVSYFSAHPLYVHSSKRHGRQMLFCPLDIAFRFLPGNWFNVSVK